MEMVYDGDGAAYIAIVDTMCFVPLEYESMELNPIKN